MHLGSWRDVWAPRVHQLLPRDAGGTARGASVGLASGTCPRGRAVTPTRGDRAAEVAWERAGEGVVTALPRKRKHLLGEEEEGGRLWCVRPAQHGQCLPLFVLLALRAG